MMERDTPAIHGHHHAAPLVQAQNQDEINLHNQAVHIHNPMSMANGPPPSVIEANLRFKRPPPNPASREPNMSATTEEGYGAAEMAATPDRRVFMTSRTQQQELNNIAHPNLDPTLTARLEQTTLLMRTMRSDGPYTEKLKKKQKKGWWYIHGQEPRRDQSGQGRSPRDDAVEIAPPTQA